MSADELHALIVSTTEQPSARTRAARSGPRHSISKQQPQYTFPEAQRLGLAIMDMKTLNNFEMLPGEIALVHTLGKYRHQVKVTPGQMPESFGWEPIASPYSQYLRLGSYLLNQRPIDFVFLMHTVIEMALQNERCTVDTDDFIPALGWQPHKGKTKAREEMRLQIWQWLLVLEASEIIGVRRGVYRDPAGKQIPVESWDPFIRITGKEFETGRQMRLDDVEAPLRVSFVAGETLNRFRGNSQILSFIGNIRKVGQLPFGKPKRAWARSICLALHQIWRTDASNAQDSRPGDEKNKASVKITRKITRYELLNMFEVEPYIKEIINGPNPQRAVQYWDGAIKELKSPQLDIISYYKPMGRSLDHNAPWTKEDYRYWLFDQPLDIRPNADTTAAMLEIAKRAKTARTSRKRKKKVTDS